MDSRLKCLPLPEGLGKLYKSCMPFSQTLDEKGELLEELKSLEKREKGLSIVVVPHLDEILRLTGGIDILHEYEKAGFEIITCPFVEQYNEQSKILLDTLVSSLVERLELGRCVVIHCHSGYGRAGVVVASILYRLSLTRNVQTMADVIQFMRNIDPCFLIQDRPRDWLLHCF